MQVMPRSQLPLLTSTMMIAQAVLAAPAGLRAKSSIKARNGVLLLGYAAMIAADLSFAFFNSVPGAAELPSNQAKLSSHELGICSSGSSSLQNILMQYIRFWSDGAPPCCQREIERKVSVTGSLGALCMSMCMCMSHPAYMCPLQACLWGRCLWEFTWPPRTE
jgi:hypothetical protein